MGSGPNVARWAGAFGLAALAVFLVATPLYFIGPAQPTGATDGGTLADFLTKTHTQILTRATIADPIIIGCFVVFLAGLRHLIREANPDYEWLATLIFGAGLALSTLQLVADGLQGGAALARPGDESVRFAADGAIGSALDQPISLAAFGSRPDRPLRTMSALAVPDAGTMARSWRRTA